MDYFHNINVVNTQYDRILISADQCIWHILPWKWVFFSQVYLWLWAYLRKFLRNTHFLTFCHSIYCLQNFISSDSQWLAKLVLAVQLSLKSAHNFRPEKTFCRRWVVNCGRKVVSWLLRSSLDIKKSGYKPWLGTLLCSGTQHFTLTVPLSLYPGV